jgi:hypothetical protein
MTETSFYPVHGVKYNKAKVGDDFRIAVRVRTLKRRICRGQVWEKLTKAVPKVSIPHNPENKLHEKPWGYDPW